MIKERYRICFFASGTQTGMAGHHFSVRDLGNALINHGVDVRFLEVRAKGEKMSSPLSKVDNFNSLYIDAYSPNSWKTIYSYFQSQIFDAVFCFDEFSTRIALICHPTFINRLVPVKPGWINSDSWTAACFNFINFSGENYKYYQNHIKYREVNLHLIPNRVNPVVASDKLISDLRKKLEILPVEKVIIAASRISLGDTRDQGKRDIFELALKMFNNNNLGQENWRLIMIGTPVNQSSLDWITDLVGLNKSVDLVTDENFTKNVSSIFPLAEVVVSMGRTSMEALSAGCAVLIPSKSMNDLICVDEVSFSALQDANFTHRAQITNKITTHSPQILKDIFFKKELLKAKKISAKKLFSKRLSIETAIPLYLNIVESASTLPRKYNFKVTIYSFLRVWTILFFKRLKSS